MQIFLLIMPYIQSYMRWNYFGYQAQSDKKYMLQICADDKIVKDL